MYLLRTILTARDYSLINFHSIPRDVSIITLAYLEWFPFYTLHLLQSLTRSLRTTWSSTLCFPAKETFPHHQRNDILSRRFGFPAQITATLWHSRRVTASEILHMYSITLPQTHINRTLQSHTMDNILDHILPFRLPLTTTIQVQNQYTKTNAILAAITYSKVTQCNTARCYFLTKPPSILN